MKYEVKITAIGNLASAFLRNNKSIILLNSNTYPNLADMVVEHTPGELAQDIVVGDTLILGKQEYVVTSIGEKALANLHHDGHCTLVFNESVELPGQIAVKGDIQPRLMIGDTIAFK